MEAHLGKPTKVLFIWHEKGYSTFQCTGCRLILRYVFKFRLMVIMLSSSLFYSTPTPSGLLPLQSDPWLNSPSNATLFLSKSRGPSISTFNMPACLLLLGVFFLHNLFLDPGGYWWPPTYSTWTPTIVYFIFPVSLIVAQFTIFGCFWVLNFQSRFEALNNIFSASNGQTNMSPFWTQYLLFKDVFLEEIFLTMYHARQTEVVCQSYVFCCIPA